MNLNSLKSIYQKSPYLIKKMVSYLPVSIKYGKGYAKYKRMVALEIDTDAYQLKKLKETLITANQNIPYYQKLFKQIGFHPEDLKDVKQMTKLPTIDKNIVRENYKEFINPNCKKIFEVSTGGSSGDPMRFLQSKNVWAKEMAFVHSYFERFGYDYSLKVTFRGGEFPKGRIYQFNPINNEIQFSPFLISNDTILEYVSTLNKFKPKFLHAYPSAVRILMECIIANELSLDFQFQTIFLISENIKIEDIEDFSQYFGAKVSAFYGHSERLVFAPLVSDDITYKADPKYGFVYTKDNELIGTSFDNFAMPLINYKTGDFVEYWKDGEFKIRGRWDNSFVVGRNDEKISLTALNVHSSAFENVISYQYIQDEKGKVIISCIPKKILNETEIKRIKEEFNAKTIGVIDFEVQTTDTPILTERGKFKKLISKLA
ncbi:MAG: phenylacetate--CoA ligase family protein [Brumimicrobium sp.]|nr:phenylacetate--CoA ligase family protein [Brumimicrobium sp.]